MDVELISRSGVSDSPAYFSLIALLMEIWDESNPAMLNISIFVAAVSSYIAKHAMEEISRKGLDIIRMLREISEVLVILKDGACSRREMLKFIRCNISKDLQTQMTVGMMTEGMYNELSNEYCSYVRKMCATDEATQTDCEMLAEERECEDEKEMTEGLDAVFELMAEHAAGLVAQNITKVEDGRLFVMKTPGEIGQSVVRVNLYDVNDIKNKDKRDWKYSKLRAQFLLLSSSSSLKTDRKSRVLRELFDIVAKDLTTVPGVVKEVRDLFRDGNNSFLDYEDRKRKRIDEPVESDNVIATADGDEVACSCSVD